MARVSVIALALAFALCALALLAALPPAAEAHHGQAQDGTAYDRACHEAPGGRECVCYYDAKHKGGDVWDIRTWDDGSCALKYLQLNLNNTWQFLALLAGALGTISFGWAGIVMMQDTASGEGVSRARLMVFRVGIGILVVLVGVLFLGAVYLHLFGVTEFWFGQDGKYFQASDWKRDLGLQ